MRHGKPEDRLTMSRGQVLDITNEKNSSRWLAGCPDKVPEIESEHASFVNNNDIPRQAIILVVAPNESHGQAHLAGIRTDHIIALGRPAETTTAIQSLMSNC